MIFAPSCCRQLSHPLANVSFSLNFFQITFTITLTQRTPFRKCRQWLGGHQGTQRPYDIISSMALSMGFSPDRRIVVLADASLSSPGRLAFSPEESHSWIHSSLALILLHNTCELRCLCKLAEVSVPIPPTPLKPKGCPTAWQ